MKAAGLLLAGGASSRFGAEKAVAPFGPGLVMDAPLQALAAICDLVAVSARPESGAAAIAQTCGYPVLHDAPGAPAGPLAGILEGLQWASGEGADVLLTAPCDAATLAAAPLSHLLARARAADGAVAAVSERGLEPLIAAWPVVRGLKAVLAATTDGAHPAVRTVLDSLGLVTVGGFDGANANTRAELMALGSAQTQEDGGAPHARLFRFEDDFVRTLRCIPMCIRLKLDRAAIKLSLRQWSRFTLGDRQRLRTLPAATAPEVEAYRATLVALIHARSPEPVKTLNETAEPAWMSDTPPAAVVALAKTQGVPPPTRAAWRSLSELQRYALVKLTRDKHENANFAPAMREFGLL